jgi:hypothetical protein
VDAICQVGIFTTAAVIPTRWCFRVLPERAGVLEFVGLCSPVADSPAVGTTRRFWFLWFHFHIYFRRLAAARGAINSLMGELMEDHILNHTGKIRNLQKKPQTT